MSGQVRQPLALTRLQDWGAEAPQILVVNFCAHSTDLPFGRILYSKAGQFFRKRLQDLGFPQDSIRYTSIIPYAPPLDNHEAFLQGATGIPKELRPHLKVGTKYLKPELACHLAELQAKINSLKPNLIISLGAEACQLLTGQSLTSVRGTVTLASLSNHAQKVIPTFHPAMIFKQAGADALQGADLVKALKESGFPEIVRTRREIFIPELVEECQDWWRENVTQAKVSRVSLDIEGIPARKLITCIGFAASPTKALVIPFLSKTKEGYSYWSHSEEIFVMRFLYSALTSGVEFILQNGAFDTQWLYELLALPTMNYNHDTMLLHHSLYPEMKKGLGFLAGLYTDEPAWKEMVKHSGEKSDG